MWGWGYSEGYGQWGGVTVRGVASVGGASEG